MKTSELIARIKIPKGRLYYLEFKRYIFLAFIKMFTYQIFHGALPDSHSSVRYL